VSPRELVGIARSLSIDLILVTGVRTTDRHTSQIDQITGGLPLLVEEEISESLDEAEWQNFPEYLTALGIAETLEQAQTQVNSTPARKTRDTLSLLYWLLPATKAGIASSIKEEYFRLGDLSGFKRMVLGENQLSTEILQSAYAMAAVADQYRCQLPIEVLVSALEIDYEAWLEASRGEGPAFGLLYSYASEDGGACYRTRNDVVTQAIMEVINGGRISHTGELSVLSKLIGACTGGLAVYHEFCIAVLVKSERFNDLTGQDGIALFDRAIEALPFKCRAIIHQKARWLKNKCKDPLEAERLLNMALQADNYPYARQVELDEHIYTTAAATTIDQIDGGHISMDDGKVKVRQQLAKANSSNMFLARAVHVEANLLVRLAPRMANEHSADTAILLNDTLAKIDRTLLVLRNPNSASHKNAEDATLLESVRTQLFLSADVNENWEEQAQVLWNTYRSQQGFILLGRKKFETAAQQNKGTAFKEVFDYLNETIELVKSEDEELDPMLMELMVHLYYKWRIQRAVYSQGEMAVDWEFLRDSCRVSLQSPQIAKNPFYIYIYALARAHLKEWQNAKSLLTQNRQSGLGADVLWMPREFLLEENGKARLVQGTVQHGANRKTFFSEELQADFFVDRMSEWNRSGEKDFAYIQFAFGGMKAVDRFAIQNQS